MNSLNFSNFSNLGSIEISSAGGFQKDENRLDCKPENGVNGLYEFYGRFLPNPNDVIKDSMIQKSIVKIKNPAVSGESVTFDCPKSIFQPSFFWTLDNILRKMTNEHRNEVAVTEIKKYFSRWFSVTSLMYIIQDGCHPENTGKIKVFQYGAEIKGKIQTQEKGSPLNPKCQVFDLLTGKDFHYYASKKTQTFADYSACQFEPKPSTLKYLALDGNQYEVTAAELEAMSNGQNTPLAQLYATCPSVERYKYKAPEREQLEKAATYIRIILSRYPEILQEAINSTDDREFVNLLMTAPQQQFGMQYQQQYVAQQTTYAAAPQVNTFATHQPAQNFQQSGSGVNTFQPAASPQVNTFAAQPAEQPVQGFIPQSAAQPVQQPVQGFVPQQAAQQTEQSQPEIQTFGGGSKNFEDAISNL